MQVNREVLEKNINEKLSQNISIGERYQLAQNVFSVVNLGDKDLIEKVYLDKIKPIYSKAEDTVAQLLKAKVALVPEHSLRRITLLYPNKSQDKSGLFFEISDLADKLGETNLEKMIILGFFMNAERMTIIQAYNLTLDKSLV